LRAYKAANALMDKKSPRALIGMARAYQGLKAHKTAAESCADAIKYTADDKALEASARNLRGLSLFALAEKADDKRLKEAEQEFRTVLTLTTALPIAHYNLGLVLMKQTRDQEGLAELRTFLDKAGAAPEAAAAKRFMDNPRRAREPFAPEFSVTTMEGEHLALEDLAGKVVLIDFWATWCTPCLAATPGLAKLQRKFKDEPFVILGISADRDRNAWKSFILENRLLWHHVFDDRRTIQRAFGIDVYPTYLLLDHEGIVRYTRTGWNPSVDGEIESRTKKLLKNAAAATK
jgi:thiol-disulfide isomerase/thioredoxin